MPLDPSFVGRTYGPSEPYRVSREKIREFADALGDAEPAYRDPEVARALGHPDVLAPPTFATILSLRSMYEVVSDPALGLDWSRVVHGAERYVYDRPVHAGDALVATCTVETIRSAGGSDMLVLRESVRTVGGEQILTGTTTLVARGTS